MRPFQKKLSIWSEKRLEVECQNLKSDHCKIIILFKLNQVLKVTENQR